MSISKSYNKQNGVTYVYEVYENYWNKEKKRPESKRRLIGKIDPETGEIVPTSRLKKQTEKSANSTPDCGVLYENAKLMISRQEQEIAALKDQLSSILSDELAYFSKIEHETLERKKAAEDLLHRLKKYG